MRIVMYLVLLLVTICSICIAQHTMEVTPHNLPLLIQTYSELYVLFHAPSCPHSRHYYDQFLRAGKAGLHLGVLDCEREQRMCKAMNISSYPALRKLTPSQLAIIDQQQFLVHHTNKQITSPQVILNRMMKLLKEDHVAVVLQEIGLSPKKHEDDRLFYISPPSQLHSTLMGFVNQKAGCWILSTDGSREGMRQEMRQGQEMRQTQGNTEQNTQTQVNAQATLNTTKTQPELDIYECSDGGDPQQVRRGLQRFRSGKAQRYVFSEVMVHPNASSACISPQQLNSSMKAVIGDGCRLVYFTNPKCISCDQIRDTRLVYRLMKEKEIGIENKITLSIYDTALQELWREVDIKRVPELVMYCNGKREVYGKVFSMGELKEFLKSVKSTLLNAKHKDSSKKEAKQKKDDNKQKRDEPKQKRDDPKQKVVQSHEPKADESVEL